MIQIKSHQFMDFFVGLGAALMRWRVINEADCLLGLTVIGSWLPIAPWLACFSAHVWRLILFLRVRVASLTVVVGSRFVFFLFDLCPGCPLSGFQVFDPELGKAWPPFIPGAGCSGSNPVGSMPLGQCCNVVCLTRLA